MASLPDAKAIRKLTLRGIAAYTVRSARRGTGPLRTIVDDQIIERPLRLAEDVAYSEMPNRSNASAAALAAAAVAKIMGELKTQELRRSALCLTRTAMVTISILDAVASVPGSLTAERCAALAAIEAAHCAKHSTDALGEGILSVTAAAAACADYATLLRYSGEQQHVILGEPIPVSPSFWQNT